MVLYTREQAVNSIVYEVRD